MSAEAWTQFHPGEQWRYRAPPGFEASRILIGAVFCFREREPLVACAVSGAPRLLPDGTLDIVTIPFLPMTASALAASVIAQDGTAEPPVAFAEAFKDWHDDPRGLLAFTVPFEGRLDHLIARQMAALVGDPTA